eukprot:NODE_11310_length_1295_cov_6.452055.p1 GENE.NODE_11310_length_1295_cov_6.452055~~NODE_11310_length_1295_cov_6.452055.p1  ORF type:complete len:212 (+),score=68.84 NODE_11310_length_1295_cov_6.452055:172-807(+)
MVGMLAAAAADAPPASAAAAAAAAAAAPPGVELPGIALLGEHCHIQVPRAGILELNEQDRAYWHGLDNASSRDLLAGKARGELHFDDGLRRFGAAKRNLDSALAELVSRYSALARHRRVLEQVMQGAAWQHFSRCMPLVRVTGHREPCDVVHHETIAAYRRLQKPPQCTVGASLPLRPAAMDLANILATGLLPPGRRGVACGRRRQLHDFM